ncbi:MAG: hypothetical protein VB138_09205 [Burkholderia sp.]
MESVSASIGAAKASREDSASADTAPTLVIRKLRRDVFMGTCSSFSSWGMAALTAAPAKHNATATDLRCRIPEIRNR